MFHRVSKYFILHIKLVFYLKEKNNEAHIYRVTTLQNYVGTCLYSLNDGI